MEENKTVETKQNVFIRAFDSTKTWVVTKKDNLMAFFGEHPEMLIPVISGVLALGNGLVHWVQSADEKQIDRCRIQDDVSGEYLIAKHPLKNEDVLELSERMSNGQRKSEALKEMNLLR